MRSLAGLLDPLFIVHETRLACVNVAVGVESAHTNAVQAYDYVQEKSSL